MKRHPDLVQLSQEHHHGLVMALRIRRELPSADETRLQRIYDDLIAFWAAGLLPHFRTENECLLARLVRHVPLDDELVLRTHRDHLGMEALVATMRDTKEIEERRAALLRFGESLRDHIKWEEEVLFEATQDQLAAPEMASLGEEIRDRSPDVPEETILRWVFGEEPPEGNGSVPQVPERR